MTLAELSESVLLTAAAIAPESDSSATARLLYHANWLPLTPAWLARFPDEDAVVRYVTGATGGADGTLANRWLRSDDPSWIHWNVQPRREAGAFKVYVSVQPPDLPAAFERCVAVFLRLGTPSFKLARRPRSLLRPDRLVAYTAARDETERLVAALADALDGCAGQGVPFTSGTRALSWARDPAGAAAAYGPSWRSWITRKLAAYLHASDAPDALGRAAFAVAKLGDDGVDTATWAPSPALWASP